MTRLCDIGNKDELKLFINQCVPPFFVSRTEERSKIPTHFNAFWKTILLAIPGENH